MRGAHFDLGARITFALGVYFCGDVTQEAQTGEAIGGEVRDANQP